MQLSGFTTQCLQNTTDTNTMDADTSSQLGLINHLLSEKDRLITEKDELVASKDALWRGLHRMMCEKDAEISTLTERNKALKDALETLLRETSASRGRDEEACNVDVNAIRLEDLKPKRTVEHEGSESELFVRRHIQCKPHNYTYRLDTDHRYSCDETQVKEEDLHASTLARPDSSMRLSTSLETSRSSSPASEDYATASEELSESPSVRSDRLSTLTYRRYDFVPLIRLGSASGDETGQIQEVPSSVIDSILATLAEIDRRYEQGVKNSRHPQVNTVISTCAWLWAVQTGARWTADAPRKYACFACFNARRACFVWQGSMRWLLLPLHPRLRRDDATWKEARYYIYQGSRVGSSFEGMWEENKRGKKRNLEDGDV